ncbi:hypothetical protein [Nocardia rhizosphaerae]|uniref:Uncharacterized protein n=1 Tax=Nocardia rhizosphaerae TaxID=1691571 RepID=A0ABV8L5E8_9NOCA
MKRWIIAVLVELGLAVLCLAGAVYSWTRARRSTEFATAEDHPAFEAVRYVPPLVVLATALVILAGLLVIAAVARIVAGSVARGPAGPMH